MANRPQDAQAVEREAAVPGGVLELPRCWVNRDDLVSLYGGPVIGKLHPGCRENIAATASPAHRPPQPGVTEELRALSNKAQQGPWHTNENHSTVLGEPTEHDKTLFQTVCCAPHRAMSNPDRKRQWYADKAFIVASVNFVRALLAAPSPGASVTASPADGDVIDATPSAPGGESGWRWVPVEPTEEMWLAVARSLCASGDTCCLNTCAKCHSEDDARYAIAMFLAATPPGAPPVSALERDSGTLAGQMRDQERKRDQWLRDAKIMRGYGPNTSFDEVWEKTCLVADSAGQAKEERDRLTTAAQAARDALENVHRTLNKPNPGICCTVWLDGSPAETLSDHVEAALASLVAVLPASTTEPGPSQEPNQETRSR